MSVRIMHRDTLYVAEYGPLKRKKVHTDLRRLPLEEDAQM